MDTVRMDTARYVIALLTIILFPPVLLFWFLIHPFVRLWPLAGLGDVQGSEAHEVDNVKVTRQR